MKAAGLFICMTICTQVFATNYYIDFVGGSDTNAGTSEAAPWMLAPGMRGFAGRYTHVPGDQFIFKGGVTWPKSALPLIIGYSGAAGAVDVYGGEDHTWYSGGEWSQPVFDGQQLSGPGGYLIGDDGKLRSFIQIDNIFVKNSGNAVTGTHDGPDGSSSLSDSTQNWAANQWVNFHVYNTTDGSSCRVTASTSMTVTCTLAGGKNNAWNAGDTYIITDGSGTAINFNGGGSNIEISFCTLQPSSVQSFGYANAYLPANANSAHIYIHDNNISLGGRMVIYGFTGHVVDDVQVYRNRVQGAGKTPLGSYHLDGLMIGNPSTTDCSATLTPTVTHIAFHDNYLYGSWPGGPTALYFSNACTNYTTIYNNVFALETVETAAVGALMRWQDFDGNIAIYNNVFSTDANPGYDGGAGEALQLGASYQPMYGALAVENNIFSGLGLDILGGTFSQWSSVTVDYNLHNPSTAHGYGGIVWFGGFGNAGQCSTLACAQAQGWETHSPALGPPDFVSVPEGTVGSGDFHLLSNSPARGAGINLSPVFTTDAAGQARPSAGPWDMGVFVAGSGEDFSVVVAPGSSPSATVTAGQTANYTLEVSPLGGFNQPVNFSCSGAPSYSNCSVSPSPLTLNGASASTASVTVSTSARSALGMRPKPPAGPWIWVWTLGLLAAVGLSLMGGRSRSWLRAWTPLAVAAIGFTFWVGCGGGAGGGGGGSNPGTPAGTYTLTVTGNYLSGTTNLQHNLTLTLTVN